MCATDLRSVAKYGDDTIAASTGSNSSKVGLHLQYILFAKKTGSLIWCNFML